MTVLNIYKCQNKQVPANAVYIGRANNKLGLAQSKWFNPFPITDKQDRAAVVAKYKAHLWRQLLDGSITKDDLLALQGKDLVCYCAPLACHGDVLEAAIKWALTK